MSKKVSAEIQCPSCKEKFNTELYRTIWIEEPQNLDLIINDEVNRVTCPSCGVRTNLKFPFLCTNVKKEIAIWFEPYHDPAIDKDIEKYRAHMGNDSFYANAPRIKDWREFKERVLKLEGGESNAGSSSDSKNDKFDLKFNSMDDIFKSQIFKDVSEDVSGGRDDMSNLSGQSTLGKGGESYPKYLKHLRANSGRLKYAALSCSLFLLFIFVANGYSQFMRVLEQEFTELIIASVFITLVSYAILSIVNFIASKWRLKKGVRVWVFSFIFWVILVGIYVVLFDPYDRMYFEEIIHMLMVMGVPPVFIGSAKYIYEAYIK